jgi:methylmalonyl-CoA/ethylmalonyl-CoA epimerase
MLENRPVSHYGYAVPNIAEAARTWSTLFGAGPFLLIEKMQFDAISYFGEACTYVHSAAFGQWGSTAVELMQFYECSPPSLAQKIFPSRMPVLNHVAYLSSDPAADGVRLASVGATEFLYAKMGEVEVRLYDAAHVMGCAVEIHRKTAFIQGFFDRVERESRGWDGRDPLRLFKP